MNNTSINQLTNEIATAKKQALRDPHRYERPDTENGNSLTDLMSTRSMQSGKQTLTPALKAKIEQLFAKFPHQYKLLGLYYSARFTVDEIANLEGINKGDVSTALKRAKDRLKKYLTELEYDSIRWAIGDPKGLQATPMSDEVRERIARYKEFTAPQPVYTVGWSDPANDPIRQPIKGLHPPAKNLPIPRGVLLGEMTTP